MVCPECGTTLKTCCQLYIEKYPTIQEQIKNPHSCGQQEFICKCGYRAYNNEILSFSEFTLK